MRILGLDLERLIRIVEASKIDNLEIKGISGRVKIEKIKGAQVTSCYLPPLQEKKKIDQERRKMKYSKIKSPGVGIFYLIDPRVPNAKPYVKKGSNVKNRDVVGLIKYLNFFEEIKSPCSGRVREIYVQDKGFIDYNKPLFKIRNKN